MADERSPKDKELGRRDTIKLASAIGALGIGLGVLFDSSDAEAAPARLAKANLGRLTMKFYKLNAGDNTNTLVQTVSLAAFAAEARKGGTFALKFYNQKDASTELVLENELEVVAPKG